MRFFWGFLGVVIGVLVIKYTFQLVGLFGRVDWAETHLRGGMGGTYTLYKIAGVVVILLSMLYMFGGIGFIVSPLAPLFGGVR
ncbi:MAG: hypothetical protein ACM3NH_04700 [Candidatus Saccharibacteria bacterium]